MKKPQVDLTMGRRPADLSTFQTDKRMEQILKQIGKPMVDALLDAHRSKKDRKDGN